MSSRLVLQGWVLHVRALGPAVIAAMLVACAPPPTADPAELRFSAIPDQAPERVLAQHQPLMDRLCAAAQRRCRWVAAESYEALVDRFGRGEIDVAYFGGVTFAQARHRHSAVPLALRDVDFRFTSVILVRKDSPQRNLDALRQQSFTFANRNSTSGHYMLRQRLAAQGIDAERYFGSVAFASDHDAAMREVASGRAAAAGVNATVYYTRVAAGDPSASALRVVWQTPPYTDYVWAGRSELSAALRQQLIDALLDLNAAAASDRDALRAESAGGYVPAFPEDFDEVSAVLRSQGRL